MTGFTKWIALISVCLSLIPASNAGCAEDKKECDDEFTKHFVLGRNVMKDAAEVEKFCTEYTKLKDCYEAMTDCPLIRFDMKAKQLLHYRCVDHLTENKKYGPCITSNEEEINRGCSLTQLQLDELSKKTNAEFCARIDTYVNCVTTKTENSCGAGAGEYMTGHEKINMKATIDVRGKTCPGYDYPYSLNTGSTIQVGFGCLCALMLAIFFTRN
jgi:hypothetical protein